MVRYYSKSQLESIVGRKEQILWRAKPNKLCYVLESIFNPTLPFALIWLLVDSFFISGFFSAKGNGPSNYILVPFFLFHLMPVWIYLGGVLTTFLRYKNTEYIITDKRIYTSGGTFSYTEHCIEYADIKTIRTEIGFFDKILSLGDVIVSPYSIPDCVPQIVINGKIKEFSSYSICDIPDFRKVYRIIRENVDIAKQETTTQHPKEELVDQDIQSYLDMYRKIRKK